MVAALAELHENVEKLHLPRTAGSIHHINVLHQDLGVPAHTAIHTHFNLLTHQIEQLTILSASWRDQHKS